MRARSARELRGELLKSEDYKEGVAAFLEAVALAVWPSQRSLVALGHGAQDVVDILSKPLQDVYLLLYFGPVDE